MFPAKVLMLNNKQTTSKYYSLCFWRALYLMRGKKGGWRRGSSRMLNSEFNILLDLFVWSRPNAIIRSTFSTECRKASKQGAWQGSWRGFSSAEDLGTDFFEGRGMKWWAEMKEETAELWNLVAMIGERGAEAGARPNVSACKCFSFIKSHLSACQQLWRDGSRGLWLIW